MSERKIKIQVEYLSKKFELLSSKESKTTKSKAKTLVGMNNEYQKDFWALRNISFNIYDGECVGIIGLNGAGKSTLSNIVSGQILQTAGNVKINGEVSIIAANAGMKANLSGRENIHLKGLMLGMSNKEIESKMESIIEFSELGPFIDQPIKTYSSGMKAKLGFSIMVHQNPDIMIIDEGLSVGDKTFVDKSQRKMFEFRDQGKTILLVSHDMRTVKDWCDRLVWLDYGRVKASGTPDEVIPEYEKFVKWFNSLSKKEQADYKKKSREGQFDYSIEALKEEIVVQHDNSIKGFEKELHKALKNKDDHKFSLFSKLIIAFCLLTIVWSTLVSMSSTTFFKSIQDPRTFLTEQLFQEKTTSQSD